MIMLRSLAQQEKYFLGITIVSLLLIISVPYLWAWSITPAGFHFSGILFNSGDQNVHLAWARQAYEGHFTLRDMFTSESLGTDNSLFINLYTTAIGISARLTHISIIWMAHLFRLIFAVLAMVWFYDFCSQLTTSVRTRYLALLFAAFSTGVGWLWPLFPNILFMDKPNMPDFPMMPESYVFTSAYTFGLNIASLALIVLVYGQLLRAEQKQSWKNVGVAAIAAFLLANIHTYDALPMLGVLGIWTFWRLTQRKSTFSVLALGTVIVGAILPVIYQYIVFQHDTQFRLKAITYTQAPHLPDVLVSYGLVFIFAIAGVILFWRLRQNTRHLLLIAWIFVTIIVIYVPALLGHPISFERKMIEGMHWPLCILAAIGLAACLERIHSLPLRNIAAASVVIISSISSFQFVVWSVATAQDRQHSQNNALMPPLYISNGDQAAINYLKIHYDNQKAVLSLAPIGNYIPPQTGMTVYLGHWAETINYQQKELRTMQFFQGGMSPKKAKMWLNQNHIGYILIGSYERQIDATLPLPLKPIFTSGTSTIYTVK